MRRRDLYDKSKMAREPGKNYKALQGNQCFSRFTAYRCLESLRINIFWKELIIAEALSTICINSAEFLVKISLVKCVVNWSLGQFETFVVQNIIFDRLWPLGCYCELQLNSYLRTIAKHLHNDGARSSRANRLLA